MIKVVNTQPEIGISDEILASAVETFIHEVKAGKASPNINRNIQNLFILHKTKRFRISHEDFGIVVAGMVRRHYDDPKQSIYYAEMFPDHPLCAEVIKRHEISQSAKVAHSQSGMIIVTQ